MSHKYGNLIVLCNGCGNPMRDMGEWPICYPAPKEVGPTMNVHQANRYMCTTCKMPHPDHKLGTSVMATILAEAV